MRRNSFFALLLLLSFIGQAQGVKITYYKVISDVSLTPSPFESDETRLIGKNILFFSGDTIKYHIRGNDRCIEDSTYYDYQADNTLIVNVFKPLYLKRDDKTVYDSLIRYSLLKSDTVCYPPAHDEKATMIEYDKYRMLSLFGYDGLYRTLEFYKDSFSYDSIVIDSLTQYLDFEEEGFRFSAFCYAEFDSIKSVTKFARYNLLVPPNCYDDYGHFHDQRCRFVMYTTANGRLKTDRC